MTQSFPAQAAIGGGGGGADAGGGDGQPERLMDVYEQLEDLDAATAEPKAARILFGLGQSHDCGVWPRSVTWLCGVAWPRSVT